MGAIKFSPATACKAALLVMGGTATAAQILIIRELLVTFHGSELAIGIILANWLILEAAGSYWARTRAASSQKQVTIFALLQVGVGLGCLFSILFIRSFKYLFHISTGEILNIMLMAGISLMALAPVAIADGVLFPFGCKGLLQFSRKQEVAARVYLYQAIGSFITALFFVFYLIAWLNTFELAFILLIVNCCSAVCYVTASGQAGWLRNGIIILLTLSFCTFFLQGGRQLHEFSSRLLWYEHDLQDSRNSIYANIAVISKQGQYTFFANGIPYATTPQPSGLIEEKVHIPMLHNSDPQAVLLIGGGAGGIIREILKHPVATIDYLEQDPLIISCFQQFATSLTDYELTNEKVHLHSVEGRLFLKKTAKRYDVILANFPVPSTLLLNRYYTVEFFRLVREHLTEDGLFAINLPGSETFLSQELKNLNQTIFTSLKLVFPRVRIVIGNENIYLAAPHQDVANIGPETLIDRLTARNISTGLITDWYLLYKMDPDRFGPLAEAISKGSMKKTNHDQHPISVFESMLYLNMVSAPVVADLLTGLANIPLSAGLALLGFALLIAIANQWLSGKRAYIMTALISTGFTGMFMNMTMILAFQIYYGNIYHYIGLLISLFMLGLASGSLIAMKRQRATLTPVEAAIVIHTLLVYTFFAADPEGLFASAIMIFVLCFFSGVLTGAEYPIAINLASQSGQDVSTIGGKLYAADLVGAFFGAIATSVFLLPAMGIKNASLMITALKGGSLALTYLGEKK